MVVVLILSILIATTFVNYGDILIRAKLAYVKTSIESIQKSLRLYYADYNEYPNTTFHGLEGRSIHEIQVLQYPVNYIGHVPVFPWMGQYITYTRGGKLHEGYQGNFRVQTLNLSTHPHASLKRNFFSDSPGFAIYSGGPVTNYTGTHYQHWYSTTNGIRSYGGFWHDTGGHISYK